jgi:hypothetical protein
VHVDNRALHATSAIGRRCWATALSAIALLVALAPAAGTSRAEPSGCNHITCVPGVGRDAVIGAYCDTTEYFVFAVTAVNKLVFCGSPRGRPPRYFRSPQLAGIRDEGTPCYGNDNDVAQAPDGLFLLCGYSNAQLRWIPAGP